MKKVIKSATIGIILLGIIGISNNPILKFIARKLLAPYYIVGIIMLIGSFFGICFGRKGGSALNKIVSLLLIFGSIPIFTIPSISAANNSSDVAIFNWSKFFLIVSIAGASILFIFLTIVIIRVRLRKKRKNHDTNIRKISTQKSAIITRNITDVQQTISRKSTISYSAASSGKRQTSTNN